MYPNALVVLSLQGELDAKQEKEKEIKEDRSDFVITNPKD
jgi:hypothetical protein